MKHLVVNPPESPLVTALKAHIRYLQRENYQLRDQLGERPTSIEPVREEPVVMGLDRQRSNLTLADYGIAERETALGGWMVTAIVKGRNKMGVQTFVGDVEMLQQRTPEAQVQLLERILNDVFRRLAEHYLQVSGLNSD